MNPRRNNIDFHIICVVTKETLEHAEEIYSFFKLLGVNRIAINIEEMEGSNRNNAFQGSEYDQLLRHFIRKLCELWIAAPYAPTIREFNGLVSAITHGAYMQNHKMQESSPCRIINVDVNGNFSSFSPELLGHDTKYGNFLFGNVMDNSLEDMIHAEKFISVYKDIRTGIEECRKRCAYFPLCGGGAPSNKISEKGTFECTETRYCITNKQIIIDEVLGVLEQKIVAYRESNIL